MKKSFLTNFISKNKIEEMCKSKWRNVRDAYRKIQRSHQKNPNDSNYVNRHPELAFLDDCPFKPRTRTKNQSYVLFCFLFA